MAHIVQILGITGFSVVQLGSSSVTDPASDIDHVLTKFY